MWPTSSPREPTGRAWPRWVTSWSRPSVSAPVHVWRRHTLAHSLRHAGRVCLQRGGLCAPPGAALSTASPVTCAVTCAAPVPVTAAGWGRDIELHWGDTVGGGHPGHHGHGAHTPVGEVGQESGKASRFAFMLRVKNVFLRDSNARGRQI